MTDETNALAGLTKIAQKNAAPSAELTPTPAELAAQLGSTVGTTGTASGVAQTEKLAAAPTETEPEIEYPTAPVQANLIQKGTLILVGSSVYRVAKQASLTVHQGQERSTPGSATLHAGKSQQSSLTIHGYNLYKLAHPETPAGHSGGVIRGMTTAGSLSQYDG